MINEVSQHDDALNNIKVNGVHCRGPSLLKKMLGRQALAMLSMPGRSCIYEIRSHAILDARERNWLPALLRLRCDDDSSGEKMMSDITEHRRTWKDQDNALSPLQAVD